MNPIYDDGGNIIAWWYDDKSCSNATCKKAIAAGRSVHLVPSHTDPRAEAVHLVLPDYHFETSDEAIAALEIAWLDAETATTFAERNSAYSRNVPVKVSHNVVP